MGPFLNPKQILLGMPFPWLFPMPENGFSDFFSSLSQVSGFSSARAPVALQIPAPGRQDSIEGSDNGH